MVHEFMQIKSGNRHSQIKLTALREKLYRPGSLTHHNNQSITAFETVCVAFILKVITFALIALTRKIEMIYLERWKLHDT